MLTRSQRLKMADRHRYAAVVVGASIVAGLYLISRHNYLLFHSLAELFSIVVAVGIFALAWHTRRALHNNYLLFIGIAYLFVASIDLAHTLAYSGMGVFPGHTANLPTQLWLCARYIESASLLAAPLLIHRKTNTGLVFLGYAIVCSLLIASIFGWGIFPDAFVDGSGLTTFKVASEYVISLVLLGAAYLLYERRGLFERTVYRLLLASILVTVGSELMFTLYTDPFGLPNFLGHILKIISFFLLYRALIETGLVKPYNLLLGSLLQREQALRESREQYAALFRNLADAVFSFREGVIAWCNDSAETLYGYRKEELIGTEASFFYPNNVSPSEFVQEVARGIKERGIYMGTTSFQRKDGKWVDIEYSVSQLSDKSPPEIIAVARDITERRRADEALRESEEKYRLLVETLNEGIWAIDCDANTTFVNPRMAEMLGRTVDEMLGKSLFSFMREQDVATAMSNLQLCQEGDGQRHGFEFVKKDGQRIYTSIETSPILDRDGTYLGGIAGVQDITDLKDTEEALRLERNRAQRYLDVAGAILVAIDSDQSVTLINQKGCTVLQYPEKEIVGKNWFDSFVPAGPRPRVKKGFEQMMAGAIDPVDYLQSLVLTRSGETRTIAWYNTVLRDSEGKITATLSSGEDITERMKAEEALRESEEKYRHLVEALTEGLWVIDKDAETTFVNEPMAVMLGYTVDEMMGQHLFSFMDRQGMAISKRNLERGRQGISERHDFEFIRKDGRRIFTSMETSPILDSDGSYMGAIAGVQDITDLKLAQEALTQALSESQQRQEEVEALLEGSRAVLAHRQFPDAARAIFDSCKKSIGAAAGYVALMTADGTENDVLFLDSGDVPCSVDPSLPMPIRGLRAQVYETGRAAYDNDFAGSKWTQYLPEGHVKLDNALFAPLLIEGRAVGLLGLANKAGGFTANDVSLASAFGELAAIALRNTWSIESLEDSEERFRSVVETAGDAIISTDSNGDTVYWNRAAERVFGYRAHEMIGRPATTIMPERLRPDHLAGLLRVGTTGETRVIGSTVEMAGLRKDGREFPLELTLATWKSRSGMFFTAVVRDITERKKLDQLKDEFIGLVSHELRSPLTVVMGAVNTALTEMQRLTPEETRQLLEDAASEADVLSHLLGNLLELSRSQADRLILHFELLDIRHMIRSVVEKISERHVRHTFLADVPAGLPPLPADRLRVERILYNLLENAAKYSPHGGEVRVSVERDDDRLVVGISDQGIGIAVEHQAMLFQPFQRVDDSMRARVKGIGLGLLVCRRLVEAHGGRIWVESEPGKGAAFYFTMPLVQPESGRDAD